MAWVCQCCHHSVITGSLLSRWRHESRPGGEYFKQKQCLSEISRVSTSTTLNIVVPDALCQNRDLFGGLVWKGGGYEVRQRRLRLRLLVDVLEEALGQHLGRVFRLKLLSRDSLVRSLRIGTIGIGSLFAFGQVH